MPATIMVDPHICIITFVSPVGAWAAERAETRHQRPEATCWLNRCPGTEDV
jgi:hypothetical protein